MTFSTNFILFSCMAFMPNFLVDGPTTQQLSEDFLSGEADMWEVIARLVNEDVSPDPKDPDALVNENWTNAWMLVKQSCSVFVIFVGVVNSLSLLHSRYEQEKGREKIKAPKLDQANEVLALNADKPITTMEWTKFINCKGEFTDVENLKRRIFKRGINDDLRTEAWPFLLGFYEYNSTYKERADIKKRKTEEYWTMKEQWQSISENQLKRNKELAKRMHIIQLDVLRADRSLPFYKKDNNINMKVLEEILTTFCMYNFDLGYVQGMCDILQPIFYVLDDEVEAFWCFANVMELEERNFEMSQGYIDEQLSNIRSLISALDQDFLQFFEKHYIDHMGFCFQWLLLSFGREFAMPDVCTLWEAIWTQRLTPNFKLFVCLAILERQKNAMMTLCHDDSDITRHINSLACKIDVRYVISRAEFLCLHLQQSAEYPISIRQLAGSAEVLNAKEPALVLCPDTVA